LAEVGAGEIGLLEHAADDLGAVEVGAGEARPLEPDLGELGARQLRPGEVGASKIQEGEGGALERAPGADPEENLLRVHPWVSRVERFRFAPEKSQPLPAAPMNLEL